MGTWIELRCENITDPSAVGAGLLVGDRCWSHDNSGPMAMACTWASIVDVVRQLEAQALRTDWRKSPKGWVRPYCVSVVPGGQGNLDG